MPTAAVPTDWHPSESAFDNLGSITTEFDRVKTALAAYGMTGERVSGHYLNTATAVETSFRNKIIEFFNL